MFPGGGLVWAEWQRVRKALGIGLALQVAVIAFILGRRLTADGVPVSDSVTLGSFAVAVYLIAVLLLAQSTPREMRFSIPRRYYLLPIGTARLVFWLFAFRLSAVLFTAVLGAAGNVLAGAESDTWLTPLLGFAVVFAVLQTLVWLAPWAGHWATYTISLLVLGPIAAFIHTRYGALLPDQSLQGIVLSIGCVCASYIISCLAIRSLRSSGQARSRFAGGSLQTAAVHPGRSHSFTHPALALSWFEWRDTSSSVTVFFAGLLLAMTSLLHIGSCLEKIGGGEADFQRQWMNGFFLLLSTAVLARLWMGTQRVLHSRRGPDGYLHRLPLGDADLAERKIVNAVIAVLAWSAVLVAGTITLSALAQWVSSRSVASVLPAEPMWAFLPIILVSTWVAYWQGGLVLLGTMGFLAVTWMLKEFAPTAVFDTAASPATGLFAATSLCAAVAAPSFLRAWRYRLLSVRDLSLCVGAMAGICFVYTFLFRTCGFLEAFTDIKLWLFSGALSLLAVSPFAAAPSAVCRARHR
ncbi:MAG: hypothetical protein IT364_20390 [Candidatus Hydrogenedentes bacterium]|nr:hypothetical protein [Candidatus Hydrogenedentota bacterium]